MWDIPQHIRKFLGSNLSRKKLRSTCQVFPVSTCETQRRD